MPPLVNAAGIIQCAHGGLVPMLPTGKRPLVGGAPGMLPADLLGKVALGCTHHIGPSPAPCVITGVIAGICGIVDYGGQKALNQGVVCMTSNGVPTIPCGNAGQTVVQGV
jgi:hypothetical protein